MLAAAAHSARAQSPAAPSAQLPPKWNDAVHALAEKIAAAAGQSRKISLDLKNISSLGSTEVTAIREELENELKQRHLRITPASSAEAKVNATLSEGVEGYVWSAEVHRADTNQTFLLAVPRGTPTFENTATGSLTLDAKLVWEQPGKFLDFKLFVNPVGVYWTLVVLEPERLAFYRSLGSSWELWRAIPISHSEPWPRDLRGGFSVDASLVYLPGIRCTGDFESAKVDCSPFKQSLRMLAVSPKVPGAEGAESVTLFDRCGDKSIVLASGNGDWTQPDTVQGYLFTAFETEAVRSGSPIRFDGPVVDMYLNGRDDTARAVVRNLKTDNYEAYLVTATCGH